MLQPTRLISTPFAQEGDKTEIQNVTGEFDNSATYRLGFPPLTMQSIRSGGKPPKGTDFNGVLFDITENISFLCKGGRYQYNAGLSTLIGGYPEGSNLLLDDNVTEVVSTVAGNQNNPNINMTGWILKPNKTTAANVADASGETQQQVNYNGGSKWHSRVGGYKLNERVVLTNGDIVKSTIDGNANDPNVDMTGWLYEANSSQLTVDNFGAKGDGVTDDSAAFQAYIDSALTGINVYLGHRKAVYRLKKQVNFKGKGLVGSGFTKQDDQWYHLNSIWVEQSDAALFTNTDPKLNNAVMVNVGAYISNFTLNCNATTAETTLKGIILLSGYNITIKDINLRGFQDQIYCLTLLVSFRVDGVTSLGAQRASFYIADSGSAQSTTAYFRNCSWQWGKYPIYFEKDAYGCVFQNNVIEYMDKGYSATVFSACTFDQNWCEQTRTGVAADWIENRTNQQLFSCVFGQNYIRTPWIDRTNATSIAVGNNAGGVSTNNSAVAVSGATGAKVVLTTQGLSTRFGHYYGASNNPLNARKLSITTQDAALETNYVTPVVIEAPNGALWFKNRSDTDYTPVTTRTLIGANADNTAAYYGVDTYTKTMRKWSTLEHGSNNSGYFYAPMLITYQSNVATQQSNNGWTIEKESTGRYYFKRVDGNTGTLSRPHVIVGGVTVGAGVGGTSATLHTIQWVESYSGSWQTYGVAAGFRIFFRDIAGALVDVQRFTVSITSST